MNFRSLNRSLLAASVFSLSGSWAIAEDQKPRLSWKGWFAGAHVGGFFGKVSLSGSSVTGATNGSVDGVVGGAIGGYNFRNGNWVFGAEADFGWANISGTGAPVSPPPPPVSPPPPPPPPPPVVSAPVTPTVTPTPTYRYDINNIAHFRAKIGHLITPNTLIFVAGGLAIAGIDVSETSNVSGWNGHVLSDTYTGWTIGVGVEQALCEWASARLEYLYDDFGSQNFSHGTHHQYNVRARGSTIRGVINIHFN